MSELPNDPQSQVPKLVAALNAADAALSEAVGLFTAYPSFERTLSKPEFDSVSKAAQEFDRTLRGWGEIRMLGFFERRD